MLEIFLISTTHNVQKIQNKNKWLCINYAFCAANSLFFFATPFHQNLENTLSDLHCKDAALVFNSAYLANQTTIWTICKAFKDICVFSDSLERWFPRTSDVAPPIPVSISSKIIVGKGIALATRDLITKVSLDNSPPEATSLIFFNSSNWQKGRFWEGGNAMLGGWSNIK